MMNILRRGEANVTLGIPRLRELFMTAASSIKTPIMTLPLKQGLGMPQAAELTTRLRHICLAEVLEGVTLSEQPWTPSSATSMGYARVYKVMLHFQDPTKYPPEVGLDWQAVKLAFSRSFIGALTGAIKADLKRGSATQAINELSVARAGGEEAGASSRPSPGGEGDGTGVKARKSEKEDEDENQETEEEFREGKLQWAGGRKEEATYDAGDNEDAAIAASARRQAEAASGNAADAEEQPDSQESAPGPERPEGRKPSSKSAGPTLDTSPEINEDTLRAEVSVALPMSAPKLLFVEMVERLLRHTMVKQVPGIQRTYTMEGSPPTVQTDGINFGGIWPHTDLIDMSQITTNDVSAVLHTYGVEAARATLMREVRSVFGAYGIGVDPRHLGLIADFMTHQGGYRACNRLGIESSTSTFLKISFETAAYFLTDATMKGATDDLASPASRLVVGRVVELGTGSHDLIQNLT
eukprot:jgi/Astpho2/2925/Aster-x1091